MRPLNYKTRRLGPLMQWWVGLPDWLSFLVLLCVVLAYGAAITTVTVQVLKKYGPAKKKDAAKPRVVTKTITRVLPCNDTQYLETRIRLARALEGQEQACKDIKARAPCICNCPEPTVKKRRRRRSRKRTSKKRRRSPVDVDFD